MAANKKIVNNASLRRQKQEQQRKLLMTIAIIAICMILNIIVFIARDRMIASVKDEPVVEDNNANSITERSAVDAIDSVAQPMTEPATESATEPTEEDLVANAKEITAEGEIINYNNAVAVLDNIGYELYTYSGKAAQNYGQGISDFADALAGTANVYVMPVPLSSGVTFPDAYRDQLPVSDMSKACSDILDFMDANVHPVNVFNSLYAHRDEYIFFKTDHHWTALGAYYGYTTFCKVKGTTPNPIESFATKDNDDFCGSLYYDTKDQGVRYNRDTITAYYPNGTDTMTITDNNGKTFKWSIISDGANYNPGVKYSLFIGGDNPYSVIENPNKTDGSSILLVKESFGNAFAPFLVDDYQTVYIVDYRYYTENTIYNLVVNKGIKDVLFVNNLSAIRNSFLVNQLRTELGV